MKIHLLLLCFFVASFAVGNSFAQIADPHCYYPKFDNRSEVDTIYGNYTDQFLGDFFRLPPLPNTTTSRLAISGLKKGYSQYWEIDPQAPFNLHNLTITNPERLERKEYPRQNVYGHFRNSKDWDMISGSGSTYFIYWSDANGLYDTSRRSYLSISVSKYHFNFARTGDLPPIVTHCSSDTVDDIFFGVTTTSVSGQDTTYLAQYVGGEGLKTDTLNTGIRVVNPDTLYFFDTSKIARRTFKSGNFSGSGHRDVVGKDRSDNLFYYRNSGKFDPQEFAKAMLYDTLVVAREQHYSTLFPPFGVLLFQSAHADRVLSKPDTDSSEDLMFWYVRTPEDGTSGNRIRMAFLQGGVNFGSTRIQLDSVPTIRDLGTLESGYSNFGPDPDFYIGQIDRSPNANKYVMIRYQEGTFYNHYFLYMLGDAFDDQADMIFEVPYPFYIIQAFDTVDANGDRYADILFGTPTYTSSTSSLTDVGTLGVIYGNAKIPHLVRNGVAVNHLDQNIPSCTIRKISDRVLQIEYSLGEVGDYVLEVRDILGRLIATKWLNASDQGEIMLHLDGALSGTYFLHIEGKLKAVDQKFFLSN